MDVAKEMTLRPLDVGREDKEGLRKELVEDMERVGFVCLTNIPGYDEEKYLSACKAFHALEEDKKKTMYLNKDNNNNPNHYRGYQPFKPNDPSHKEFYDQGYTPPPSPPEGSFPLYEATPFPSSPSLSFIREVFDVTFGCWYRVAMEVVRMIAQGLGRPADFFDPWFVGGSLTTFRTIHYLPRSAGVVDSSKLDHNLVKLTTPEHADSGFLTFLATFGYPGLQVEYEGEYWSIKPTKNTLIVNTGQLLSRLSNYRLKATRHRVLDIGRERFSSPLFLEPKYSALIPDSLSLVSSLWERERVGYVGGGGEEEEGYVLFGDWLIARLMKLYVEWEGFVVPEERRERIEKIKLAKDL